MLGRREAEQDRTMKRILLIINCIILAIGFSGGPLVMRLYFIYGGSCVWLSCFLQTAGFPIILLPLSISYIYRRHTSPTAAERTKLKMVSIKPPLFIASAVIGVLSGLNDYFYALGVSLLPVSTFALIMATNLAFTAVFSFLLVRQKFTAYSMNTVVLFTIGAGAMGLHTSGDRPAGESAKKYVMGLVMTLASATLGGFINPLVELVYKKTRHAITYSLAMEIQLVLCLFATLSCTVGMIISNDFKVIPREAKHFELGEANYYVVLVGTAIIWQLYNLGSMGVIFCASSLLSGIVSAAMIPVTKVLADIFYKEKFQAEKGISLVLSVWGSVSYFYGEFKQAKIIKNHIPDIEQPLNQSIPNP